jgi:adenylate kinase
MIKFPVNAFLLIGPTGAGKSPLGDAIAGNGLNGHICHHLDFGAELRAAVSVAARSALYSDDELCFIRGVLERGLLLENEHFAVAEKTISLFLNRVGFSRKDILVLNGLPRHEGQARDIGKIGTVHALVVLDCSAEEIHYRIRNNTGWDRTERVDDNPDMIEKKLKIYRQRTAPLIEYYRRQGCRVYRIDVTASMTPAEAYDKLSSLAAIHPPVALVAEPPQR